MGLTKTLVSECGAQSVIRLYKNCDKKATTIFRASISPARRVMPRLGVICQEFFEVEHITESAFKFHVFFGCADFFKTEVAVKPEGTRVVCDDLNGNLFEVFCVGKPEGCLCEYPPNLLSAKVRVYPSPDCRYMLHRICVLRQGIGFDDLETDDFAFDFSDE